MKSVNVKLYVGNNQLLQTEEQVPDSIADISGLQDALDAKQSELVAGNNITLEAGTGADQGKTIISASSSSQTLYRHNIRYTVTGWSPYDVKTVAILDIINTSNEAFNLPSFGEYIATLSNTLFCSGYTNISDAFVTGVTAYGVNDVAIVVDLQGNETNITPQMSSIEDNVIQL